MMDTKPFDEFARRFSEHLPAPLRSLQQEMEQQLRSLLQQSFEKMDLVTREDFDIQVALLERTRARLRELEARVTALEGGPPVDPVPDTDLT